ADDPLIEDPLKVRPPAEDDMEDIPGEELRDRSNDSSPVQVRRAFFELVAEAQQSSDLAESDCRAHHDGHCHGEEVSQHSGAPISEQEQQQHGNRKDEHCATGTGKEHTSDSHYGWNPVEGSGKANCRRTE